MGGVILTGSARKIFYGGTEATSLYVGGSPVWTKPTVTYPNQGISPSDNILMVGSSNMGVLLYSTWSPQPSAPNWYSVFRDNYSGSWSTTIENTTLNGIGGAVSYGRTRLPNVLANAQSGSYNAAVNPYTAMSNYQVLVIDYSDHPWNYSDALGTLWFNAAVPSPYDYYSNDNTYDMQSEFKARLELIRMAYAAGITKVYLNVPWPRLLSSSDDTTDTTWRANRFAPLEESVSWQLDRLNVQLEAEGIPITVHYIPFNKMMQRIYDDIQTATAPAELVHIRNIFAHDDNGNPAEVTDPTQAKQWYMLNYMGSYAMHCMMHRVFGGNPVGVSNISSTGTRTVPSAVATYFQNIAVEIVDADPRCGRTIGWSESTGIVQSTPELILGSDLVYRGTNLSTGHTEVIPSTTVKSFTAVVDINTSTWTEGLEYNALRFHSNDGIHQVRLFLQKAEGSPGISLRANSSIDWQYAQVAVAVNDNLLMTRLDAGRTILIDYELRDSPDPGGHNQTMVFDDLSVDPDIEQYSVQRRWRARHDPAPIQPTVTNFSVEAPGVTVRSIIALNRVLTPLERFNIRRSLNVEVQEPCFEILTPDQIT